jgi:hypothetical protein
MGSTSIILGEASIPTSPIATFVLASSARGGVVTLESANSGEVVLLSAALGATRLHEEELGTRTDAHVPARNQRPRELRDVNNGKWSK